MKILVVDDNDFVRNMLQDAISLCFSNVEIVCATNGQEAIDKLIECDFNLVFLDIQMPVIDGLEALSNIKEFNPLQPVYLITAQASDAVIRKAKSLGICGIIYKPFPLAEIFKAIRYNVDF